MLSRCVALGCAAAVLLAGSASAEDPPRWLADAITTEGEGEVGGAAVGGTSLTVTWMYDGSDAWVDLPNSQLTIPPQAVFGVPTSVPSVVLPAGTTVRFSCPPVVGLVPFACDAWVWMYSCPWSCPRVTDTHLPSLLLASGWTHTNCAPHFTNGVRPYQHRMIGFRIRVARGQTTQFKTTGPSANIAFGLDNLAVNCGARATEAACTAPADGKCAWDGAACVSTVCRIVSQGPPPPCTECP